VNWKVEFYNEKVEKQTIAFPKGILADFLRVVELIKEIGPFILLDAIFCTVKDKKIIILHSFVKKTQNIPPERNG
jgi:hypothetical protein